MRPVQIAVRVHHLGLDPQPELHTPGVDVVHQWGEALREHFFIDVPVAQARPLGVAVPEPAVVQYEALGADVGRLVGQRAQRVQGQIEIHGLPGIEMHEFVLAGHPRVGQATARIPVEAARQAGKAAVGARPVEHRRAVACARRQAQFPGIEQLAHLRESAALGALFDADSMIAAPPQVQAVGAADAFVGLGRMNHHPGKRIVGAAARAVLAQIGAQKALDAL